MVGAVAFIGTLIVYSGIPAGQLGKAHEDLAREVEELQCADVSDGSEDSEPAEEKAGKSSDSDEPQPDSDSASDSEEAD